MSTETKADVKTPPKSDTKKHWSENTAYRYVGDGIVPGVPDRDLTPFDVAALPPDLHREVAHSPHYKATTPKDGE